MRVNFKLNRFYDNSNMTCWFQNFISTTLSTWLNTLHRRSNVDKTTCNLEIRQIKTVVVASIGHRRAKNLADLSGCMVRRELQDIQRIGCILPTNRIKYESNFARPHAYVAGCSLCFHISTPYFRIRVDWPVPPA